MNTLRERSRKATIAHRGNGGLFFYGGGPRGMKQIEAGFDAGWAVAETL